MMDTSLKLLVDAGVGKAVEEWLKSADFDMHAVRDRDRHMKDEDILAWAVEEERLVITMDKDFGEMVFHSGESHRGVLLLRLEGATSSQKVRVIEKILTEYSDRLSGNFSVYQNGRLRVRET
jgi:predicted nuclease of predicted toxin-antitoxin system